MPGTPVPHALPLPPAPARVQPAGCSGPAAAVVLLHLPKRGSDSSQTRQAVGSQSAPQSPQVPNPGRIYREACHSLLPPPAPAPQASGQELLCGSLNSASAPISMHLTGLLCKLAHGRRDFYSSPPASSRLSPPPPICLCLVVPLPP